MEQSVKSPLPGNPPRGTFQARVDEKGRLKLPAVLQQYLSRLNENVLFITTVDLKSVRLYPTSIWAANEAIFAQSAVDPKAKERFQMVVNYYGMDSEVDGQGRVLIPARLRELLQLENQGVEMNCVNGRINLFKQQEFKQGLDTAVEHLPGDLAAMEDARFL